jgi:hypothetical protein
MERRFFAKAALICLLVAAVNCGGSNGGTGSGPGPGPSPTVNSVAVTGTTSLAPGQTAPFTATATLSNGTTQVVTTTSSWSSTNTGIASVSAAGVVTAVAPGSTDIRAVYQNVTGSVSVQVSAPAPTTTALFRVIPNADTNLPSGQCAVGQSGANNLFRCRFDASISTPNPGITAYMWEIPVGGGTFSGAELANITIPCAVGGLAGSGAIPRPVRLTVSAPGGSSTVTQDVTFIRASAC